MNLLIYSSSFTHRLQYILKFIFNEVIPCHYELTMDWNYFKSADVAKINYSNHDLDEAINIVPQGILFQENIISQQIDMFKWHELNAFFKTSQQPIPFDLFGASFYLVSRYEEYHSTEQDEFHRFPHTKSVAFRHDFLNIPLVDLWALDLKKMIKSHYPAVVFNEKRFQFTPTYDIDIAFSYQGKGWKRNLGGLLKDISHAKFKAAGKRLAVLMGLSPDPFDSYRFLDSIHQEYQLSPIYFFLLGSGSTLDKNLPITNTTFQSLIKLISSKSEIGIHPSFLSNDEGAELEIELNRLNTITSLPTIKNRQHYIRFLLPDTYRRLIERGITEEYSMGYGSINGFRASTAQSFFWFDLVANRSTNLRVYPFCFMECNSFFEQKQTAEQTMSELHEFIKVVHQVDGHFISIWHNFSLGTDPIWKSWREVYIEQLNIIKALHSEK